MESYENYEINENCKIYDSSQDHWQNQQNLCEGLQGRPTKITTNMEGVNTKEIEIEIKGNEVEISWQSDYLQTIRWSLAQTLHRYADIHSPYAKKE